MATRLPKVVEDTFENLKRENDNGIPFWSSRDLAKALDYSDYRNFLVVMRKAWIACQQGGDDPNYHFVKLTEMIKIGKGAEREVETWLMSRHACYLAMQNADSSKKIVGQAQTYFAKQTRRVEIILQKSSELNEDERKRLLLRREMSKHNSDLASAAKNAGVKTPIDYAIFQNHGYKGLYGGLDNRDIQKRKGLSINQNILDHMGSTELAANLFRATQTEDKLRREGIKGKENANKIHHQVGAKVRKTIHELGGTMPEDLPTAESIKKLERKEQNMLQALNNSKENSNTED